MSDPLGGHSGYRIGQNHRQRSTGIQVRPVGFSIPIIEAPCRTWRREEKAGLCRISEPQPFKWWVGHTRPSTRGQNSKAERLMHHWTMSLQDQFRARKLQTPWVAGHGTVGEQIRAGNVSHWNKIKYGNTA